MNSQWGFSSVKSGQSDLDDTKTDFLDKVAAFEPSIYWCIGCGSCSATCTTAALTPFNPRKLFLSVRNGDKNGIEREIGKCMLCGKCRLVCPRNVNNRHIMDILKRITLQHEI